MLGVIFGVIPILIPVVLKSPLFLAVLPSIGWPCAMILELLAFRWVAAVLAVRVVSLDWFALARFAVRFAPKWPVL